MFKFSYTAFIYDKKNTLLFRLDPRIKLLKSLSVIVTTILVGDYRLLFFLVVFLFLEIVVLARVVGKLLKSLAFLTPLIVIIFLANYLILKDFVVSIIPVLRFLIFVLAIDIFFLTTSPDDFSLTLEYLHIPLVISLSFSLALRFIPTLAIQLNEIAEAQMSRGLKLDSGGIFQRIRNYIPILIPLIVISIKKSIEVAEALEIRGVENKTKRISYNILEINRKDIIYLILSTAILIMLVVIDITIL